MTNENIDISNELALISELEDFLFFQIQTSPTLKSKDNSDIWNEKSKEKLRQEIYKLHDEGKFKESEEKRRNRLELDSLAETTQKINLSTSSNSHENTTSQQFKTEEQDQDNLNQNSKREYSFARKTLLQRLPQHYDKVITQLREFHELVENKQFTMAKKKHREVIFTYATHYDCSILASVPENLRENMQQMQARNVRTYRYDILYQNICYDYVSELLASSTKKNYDNLDALYDFLDNGTLCISKTDTLSHRIQTAIKEQINYYQDREKYLIDEHEKQKSEPLKKLLRKKTKRMPPIYLDFENESFCINTPASDHFTMKGFMKKNFTKNYESQIYNCINSVDCFHKELKAIEESDTSNKNSECKRHINSRKWLEEYPELKMKLEKKFVQREK